MRHIGRFFLALIPWALAIGGMAGLSFYVAVCEYRKQVNLDRRAAIYVAAKDPLREKITIESPRRSCIAVERADFDGSNLILHAKNMCHSELRELRYVEWHFEMLSPDRTVISDGYTNYRCPIPHMAGETAECRMKLEPNDRMKTLRVWVQE